MKLTLKSINPKHIFHSIKSKSSSSSLSKSFSSSLSKSSPPSFGSAASSSSTTSSSTSSSTSSTTRRRTRDTRSDDGGSQSPSPPPILTPTLPQFKFDVVSAFHMIDRDGDGKIDRYELKHLFNKSLTDEELGEMIKEIDRDGDGCISLDELQAVGSIFESTAHEEDELRAAFEFFDTNHDGRISASELYQGFVKLGDGRCTLEDCRRMIEEVDVNKDGFVCFQDFSRMMDFIPG
ncbi:calmodulin-like protein 3 [Silene latifolia]|uniref:calmodulin-like protein 3 n=1 Tax=Silene latifolia TaxID=37657 RepID=UPI003D789D03